MPAEITLETHSIDVERLEAIPVDLGDPHSCYPALPLRGTGERMTIETRCAVLENPRIRLTVGLDLGGRLLEIVDKRTGTAVVPMPRTIPLVPGGIRGIRCPTGVLVTVLDGDRPNALGSVEFSVRPPDEDDDGAELWLFEIVPGFGISWHQRLSIPATSATFELELRAVNRLLHPTWATLGLCFEGFSLALEEVRPPFESRGLLASRGGGALGLAFDARQARLEEGGDATFLSLHAGKLEPRQVVSASVRACPIGLTECDGFSSDGALRLEGRSVRLVAAGDLGPCKVFLATEDGRTLEAAVDFSKSDVQDLTLPENPAGLLVRDARGREVVEWPTRPLAPPPWLVDDRPPGQPERAILDALLESPPNPWKLIAGERFGGLRGPARLGAALLAIDRRCWVEATEALDDALGLQADDPLTWWLRAAVERRSGGGDETPLLNAHFLAPLEPALRAESLLAQAPVEGRGPNPLLASVAQNPEHLVEVACLYLEARLFEEAHRWIDESLRHHDLPMLRYFLAWAYLQRSKMVTEAAAEIGRARQAPVSPPLPWRPFERLVLRDLAGRFPEESRIQVFLSATEHALSGIIRSIWPEHS